MPTTKFSFQIDWLFDASQKGTVVDQDACGTFPLPLPDHVGIGWCENITLATGMSLFHTACQFGSDAAGREVALADVRVAFEEPTFQAQSASKGRVIRREITAGKELIVSPGRELFRMSEGYEATPILDCSSDLELMTLTINQSTMISLLGEQVASNLLAKLGLDLWPGVLIESIPSTIVAPLHQCMRSDYSPELRLIHAQSKSLEYLTGLAVHVLGASTAGKHRIDRRRRAQEVHDYLIAVEGRFPTLLELSGVFGRSARTLNDEFLAEFGDTIFGFMTNRRLTMAHDFITNSEVALKKIADTLGYTHVNNFSAAFRRKFGYSPGSLRRKRPLSAVA